MSYCYDCFYVSVKGFHSKFGRKLFVVDENRRSTYDVSDEPVTRTESVLATFESEMKQLVVVCNKQLTPCFSIRLFLTHLFQFSESGRPSCRSFLCKEPGSFCWYTWACCMENCLAEN